MKRTLMYFLIFVVAVSFFGCGKKSESQPDAAGTEQTAAPEQRQAEDTAEKIVYKDDQILFFAQDRCDVEDDRMTVYAYNYKGDQLSAADSSGMIGYYAENGLVPAMDPQTGKAGYVDRDGVFQIQPKYEDAAAFSEDGVALVEYCIDKEKYTYKCGYINDKGEEITPMIYDRATSFYHSGYAMAKVEKETTDEDGVATIVTEKEVVIDKTGREIAQIDPAKMDLLMVCEGYYVCWSGKECIFFDYENKELGREPEPENSEGISFAAGLENDRFYIHARQMSNGREIYRKWFDGKKFVEEEGEVTVKNVATTKSGRGCGIEKNGETKIPFEYDHIYVEGDYYVAVRITGENAMYDQTFDIYDKDFRKTAEDIPYAYRGRTSAYGAKNSRLPSGFFQIMKANEDYEQVFGIVDYRGNVIVEPVFGRGISQNTYEESGEFDW